MDPGAGAATGGGGFTPQGSRFVAPEGRAQLNSPSYSVSLRSVVIVVAVMIALIIGAILVVT
ncbi:MAG: hypothetical protein ABI658_08420 [Acidimicrobiales bacterium]